MARRRIVCITKLPNHYDKYHRITSVGIGEEPGRASARLDVAAVISNLRSSAGDRYFVRDSAGTEAEVVLRRCPHCANGHPVITTTADDTRRDNLLELRECRWE